MSADKYMFMLDDVKVTTSGSLATHEVSKRNPVYLFILILQKEKSISKQIKK